MGPMADDFVMGRSREMEQEIQRLQVAGLRLMAQWRAQDHEE